jgi:large subunit ribosomal protein L29
MPDQELRERLTTMRRELWLNRMKARTNALPKTHVLGLVRRQMARVQTVLRERVA